jgi:hypothetical protein
MTVNLKLLRGHVEEPHGWASRPYLCYKDALARHQAEHDAGGGRAGSVTRNQHTHGDDPTIPFGVWEMVARAAVRGWPGVCPSQSGTASTTAKTGSAPIAANTLSGRTGLGDLTSFCTTSTTSPGRPSTRVRIRVARGAPKLSSAKAVTSASATLRSRTAPVRRPTYDPPPVQ